MTRERRAPLPGPIGRAAAAIYKQEIGRRNRAYDRGSGVTRLAMPVVSVGNLSVGGTGKTPMVVRLVEALVEAGRRPCVAMRGYKAREGVSDEAEEYRAHLDVPIVAQPDRIAGVRALGDAVNVVVLDDGFQHRRLARIFDIVLIDATRSPFDDRLLPAGFLREPVESLERADAAVITHAESSPTDRLEQRLKGVAPDLIVGVARHAWAGVRDERGEAHLLSRLSEERALAVCAIGNPGPFIERARQECAEVVDEVVLGDHDPYACATITRIRARLDATGATSIITTGKDWPKLSGVDFGRPVLRPVLEIGFDKGWDLLRARMLEAIG